jgi:hypothetical protein
VAYTTFDRIEADDDALSELPVALDRLFCTPAKQSGRWSEPGGPADYLASRTRRACAYFRLPDLVERVAGGDPARSPILRRERRDGR